MTGLDQNIKNQVDVDQLCSIAITLYILSIFHMFRIILCT